MVNKTANQHYVAQGEQKIELVNGEVVTDRRTLNRFRISDRETWSVGAGRQIGIKSCLAVKHLFTFGRASDTEFYNFEEYFERQGRTPTPALRTASELGPAADTAPTVNG